MTLRRYRHTVTGREVVVAEGSRMAELVSSGDNWSEVKTEDKPAKKTSAKKKADN